MIVGRGAGPTKPAEQIARLRRLEGRPDERVEVFESLRAFGPASGAQKSRRSWLRVLPGTHALGRLSEARVREVAREITPIECTVGAGGVVAMRPLIVHASSKSHSPLPRRVLHIEYAKGVDLGFNIQLALE
jgi:hypothetical protein